MLQPGDLVRVVAGGYTSWINGWLGRVVKVKTKDHVHYCAVRYLLAEDCSGMGWNQNRFKVVDVDTLGDEELKLVMMDELGVRQKDNEDDEPQA